MSLSVVAEKTSFPLERLAAWEAGQARPTVNQLRKLAKTYNLSLAVFFLPTPPDKPVPSVRDFRRFPGGEAESITPEIMLKLDEAWDRRAVILELQESVGAEPEAFRRHASIGDDPEHVGERIRAFLGVSHELQGRWRDPRVGFNHWRSFIENLDVLVFQATGVAVKEFRGCSLRADVLPIVIVNRGDAYAGRSFTLLHEMTHLMLRSSGICDLNTEVRRPRADQRLEVFCNKVAAAALMPQKDVRRHHLVAQGDANDWGGAELRRLAADFSVSEHAMLLRLGGLDLVEPGVVRTRSRQLSARTRRTPLGGGFVHPVTNAVSALGKPYIRTVLEAFNSHRITASEVSHHLGVRMIHLPGVQQSLAIASD